MNALSRADLSHLTVSTLIFISLATLIALWGEAVALSYLIFHLDLSALAWALILEGVIWAAVANLQASATGYRNENLILVATAVGVACVVVLVLPLLNQGVGAGYIIFYLCARIIAMSYHQHTLAYIGPIYAARHRRHALATMIFSGRALAGLGILLLIPMIYETSTTAIVGAWLAAIAVHLAFSFWLEQAAEEFAAQSPESIAQIRLVTARPSIRHLGLLLQSGLSRWLSINTLSIAMLSGFLLYESAKFLADRLQTLEQMVGFFVFVGSVGIWLTLPLSYQLLSRLLKQVNAGRLAWVFPGALNIAFLAVVLVPSVPIVAIGEMIRRPLRITVHEPLVRLLHRAMPDAEEEWSRRLLDGMVDPLGRLLGGIILLFASLTDNTMPLLIIAFGSGVVFLVSSRQAGFLYGQVLAQSLQQGGYRLLRHTTSDVAMRDQVFIGKMLVQLESDDIDERELLLIAEVVAESELEEAYFALRTLWLGSEPSLQAELLPFIINAWPDKCATSDNRELIQIALADAYIPLRRQALQLIADYPELDPKYRIARFLIDPDPKVSVLAAWILMRHPSNQVRHAARAQLRWLANDSSVSTRMIAVNALVGGSINSFGELIYPLRVEPYMQDPATRVREAVLPAATIPLVIEALRDPSVDVRNAAIQQLRLRRFQGSIKHLDETIIAYREQVIATHHLQIELSLNFWRMLVARRTLSWQKHTRKLQDDLQEGFEQIDVIDTIIITLKHLNALAFAGVIKQLERDRFDLLAIMIEDLSIFVGKSRIEAIMWTLRSGIGGAELDTAVAALSSIANTLLANKFADALNPGALQIDNDQTPLPQIAFSVLLAQRDDWRPLLTLFALSKLPKAQRDEWTNAAAIARVIEHSLSSPSDVVREGGRLVRRLLAQANEEARYDIVSQLQKSDKERVLMLSTLERMLFLRNVSFFENLHLDQLRALARGCEEISMPENEIVIREGTVGNSLFIIVEGAVSIELPREQANNTVISELGPSDVFGEISLLDGGARTADVITRTPVLLLSIHREALHAALEDDPNIAMVMLQAMAQRLRHTTSMIGFSKEDYPHD